MSVLILSLCAALSPDDALVRAYERELALLHTELRALERREKDIEKEHAQWKAREATALANLESEVAGLEREATKAERVLDELERAEAFTRSPDELLRAARAQAELKDGDLEDVLEILIKDLEKRASITTSHATYFDERGVAHEGEIVRFGPLAASVEGRALIPTGDGHLQLAREVPAGELYVFGGLKSVEEAEEKSALDVVNSGGVVGWIIVLLGGLCFLLSILRAATLWWSTRGLGAFALDPKSTPRGVAQQIAQRLKTETADAVFARFSRPLSRFHVVILVVAAIAPLLGLLGTVTGMIATFDAITVHGTGDPRLLSGGISQALVTTELGLIVAIPTVLVGQLLGGIADRASADLEAIVNVD